MIQLFLLFVFFGMSLQAVVLDVAIIGGGQAGMAVGLALRKRGIQKVAIFDRSKKGFEGPWLTTARMPILASGKNGLSGVSLGCEELTFKAWYESCYGNWEQLDKVPTALWAEYLRWYREQLDFPFYNEMDLVSIVPEEEILGLKFAGGEEVKAKKVVLATGRDGFGGFDLPEWVGDLPKQFYFHTGERIDPSVFKGKKICVVGGVASAFDAAETAMLAGASRVDLVFRKSQIPTVNYLSLYNRWKEFYFEPDQEKVRLFQLSLEAGIPPPYESLARAIGIKGLFFHSGTQVEKLVWGENWISVETNQETIEADLLIFATGYKADPKWVPYLSLFADEILVWKDRFEGISKYFSAFPYLGSHFEFLEKEPGAAPFLKNIHCFNFGSFLSQGRISGDIDEIAIGLERLPEGIAEELLKNP